MRKIIKVTISILIIISIIIIVGNKLDTNNLLLRVNWNVSFPKPNDVAVIYSFDYREGDDFEIWKYSDSKIKKIKQKGIFTLVTSDNLQEVKNIFKSHYNDLSYNKNQQYKFNENFSINDMVVEDNYYALIKDEEEKTGCYLLLLMNEKDKEVYFFNHIR